MRDLWVRGVQFPTARDVFSTVSDRKDAIVIPEPHFWCALNALIGPAATAEVRQHFADIACWDNEGGYIPPPPLDT